MLNSLQACRAVAAILVVVFHTSNGIFDLPKYFGHKPFGPIFDFGYAGVDFFFVLSGFIMMYVHAADIGRPHALGAYLWKRFSRIYPPYWAVMAVIIPVFIFVPQFGVGHEREADVIACAIALFPHPKAQTLLVVAWTLVFEVFFYAMFALLILNKRLGLAIFAAWTACVVAFPWFETYPWNFVFSHLHLHFLTGIAVAWIVQRWQVPIPRMFAATGTLIFLIAGMLDVFGGPLSAVEHLAGYTLGSALALMGLVQAERSGLIVSPRWLVYLGNASYAIYLVHFLALSLLAKLSKAVQLDAYLPGAALYALHVVGAIGAGCLFHHLVENPLHSLTKRFFRHPRAAIACKPAPAETLRKAA